MSSPNVVGVEAKASKSEQGKVKSAIDAKTAILAQAQSTLPYTKSQRQYVAMKRKANARKAKKKRTRK